MTRAIKWLLARLNRQQCDYLFPGDGQGVRLYCQRCANHYGNHEALP